MSELIDLETEYLTPPNNEKDYDDVQMRDEESAREYKWLLEKLEITAYNDGYRQALADVIKATRKLK